MLKKWVVIVGLVCAAACAIGPGRYNTVTFATALRLQEEHQLVDPYVQRFESATMLPYFEGLLKVCKDFGITVYAVKNLAGAFGTSVPEGVMLWGFNDTAGNIYIDASLSVDEAFSTLVHELGHSLQPAELNGTADSQVWAEGLAYLVCKQLGLDTRSATFPYLQGYPNRHEVLARYRKSLDTQATALVKHIKGE